MAQRPKLYGGLRLRFDEQLRLLTQDPMKKPHPGMWLFLRLKLINLKLLSLQLGPELIQSKPLHRRSGTLHYPWDVKK